MNLTAFIPSGQSLVTVNGLHQWDYGQTLEIQMPSIGTCEAEVHFACHGMKKAVRRACSFVNGVGAVAIPDQCLEQTTPVTAWVYAIEEDYGATVATVCLQITPRTRPAEATTVPAHIGDLYQETVAEMNRIVGAFEAGEITAGEAIYASAAPVKTFENPAYDEEEGKAFVFENCNGIGLRDTTTKGFWRFWAIPNNDVLDDEGKPVYFAALTPSYDGKMTLGSSLKKIKQIFVNILGHPNHRVQEAHIDLAKMSSAVIGSLTDGKGADVYEQIRQAKLVYDGLTSPEVAYDLYVDGKSQQPAFTQGSGLYECRVLAVSSSGVPYNINIGLVRINNVTTYIPDVTASSLTLSLRVATQDNGANYTLSSSFTAESGWGSGSTVGSITVFFRKIID